MSYRGAAKCATMTGPQRSSGAMRSCSNPARRIRSQTGRDDELVIVVVADNPLNESTHYPDSDKWIVRSPERRVVRASDDDYFAGEE